MQAIRRSDISPLDWGEEPDMHKQAWQEYGTSGTTVLTPKDVERAQARLERFWQEAMRRAREVELQQDKYGRRAS